MMAQPAPWPSVGGAADRHAIELRRLIGIEAPLIANALDNMGEDRKFGAPNVLAYRDGGHLGVVLANHHR
jgi:hypothetical protein